MNRLSKKLLALFTLIGVELLILGVVALGCVAFFLFIAKLVFIGENNAFDMAAFQLAERYNNPEVIFFNRFITFFASRDFLVAGSWPLFFISSKSIVGTPLKFRLLRPAVPV